MSKARHYFGTDGIRGRVGQFPITPEFILKLGWATGKTLAAEGGRTVIVGKDTRISGYMFESALEAGFSAAGVDCYMLGPMPTPAIAYLTRTMRAQVGIVISASHNPHYDNGIKFFSAEGFKLPDATEAAIERALEEPITTVNSAELGKALHATGAHGRYIEFCKSTVPHNTSFRHLKIVLDCANGATYHVAPDVFRELGATVIEFHATPDGLNINDHCGSIHPEVLQHYVLQEQADLGIAFDGDGDRVVMVDHRGEIVDGDEILFIIAKNRFNRLGFFGGVIGTQMSNMGLEIALHDLGIPFRRTLVGDRHIMMALAQEKWLLGGESSGHVICLDVTTTGDGIISALRVLQAMTEEGKTLFELKSAMNKFPQLITNINYNCDVLVLQDPKISRVIQSVETKLKGRGRILVRPSGTEPVIRIMIEGEEADFLQELMQEVHDVVSNVVQQ